MLNMKINVDKDEMKEVLKVINKNQGTTVSVAKIAKSIGFNPNRTRFMIDALVQIGAVEKVPTKQYNARYMRYSYKVNKTKYREFMKGDK